MGLRGGFEKHCTRASLRSDTVEDLIRLSVEGGGGTRASLHSDTVEDLIRISVEGQVWKMLMLERVWSAGLAEANDQEIKEDKLQELAIRGACDCNGG